MSDDLFTVNLPDIGEGVVEGEVIEWLKAIGDELKQDEPVVVVMTDKATVELPSPYPGKLAIQHFAAGETAIKGKPLYTIETKSDAGKSQEKKKEIKRAPTKKVREAPKPQVKTDERQSTRAKGEKALATPPVRKLAKDLAIDIDAVAGSGNEGRVTKEDLQHFIAKKYKENESHCCEIEALEGDTREVIAGIPRLMAEKMAASKRSAAHFSYFEQLDATRLVQLRKSIKKSASEEGIHLTYMPFFIKALSQTLKEFPKVNSSVDMEKSELVLHKQHNIGIAMTTKLGLIVPVMRGVEELSLEEVIKQYETLKEAALNHKLKSADMKGSTITISNFGVLGGGGMWATPVINYPEVAILAVARIQKLPTVKNSELFLRDTLNLSWSFDHRVIDGDMAASFSHTYASLLQNPAALT